MDIVIGTSSFKLLSALSDKFVTLFVDSCDCNKHKDRVNVAPVQTTTCLVDYKSYAQGL